MLNFFCEPRRDEAFFNQGSAFGDTLSLCLQEVQFLDDVGVLLVVLLVVMDIGKKPPVIKVVDGILKDGIGCPVTPEAMMEPGGEWLHWLVRGVVGGGIQFNDSHFFLSLSSTMKSHHPSIVELLDEACKPFGSVIERNGEVWKAFLIFFISSQTFAEAIVFVVHPLLKCHKISLETLDFLPMDIILDLDSGSKSSNNGPELVRGWVRCGSKDILHRGGREGEPPGVGGGKSNSRTFFGDLSHSKGIVLAKAKVSWKLVNGQFRG